MSIKEKLYATYIQYKELLEKKKKKEDPKSNLHEWKKKLIESFLKDMDTVEKYMKETDATDPEYQFCRLYLPLALLMIGVAHVDLEEMSEGVDYLKKSIDLVENPLLPYTIYVSLESRNNLGYVSLRRSNAEEALKILKDAEKLYHDFKRLNSFVRSIFEDVEKIPVLGEEELEMAHTMTKFYLAQTYELLNQTFKSSVYCHETLKRQLKHKNFDPIDWALSSALLCQFFMDRMLFKQGRSHLAAASHILDEYENHLSNLKGSQEEREAKKEEFRHRSADLSWCWAKYGIIILQHSKRKLLSSIDDPVDEGYEDLKRLTFDDLDLTRYENQITDVIVVTFEDAREVFLFSQKHINAAKEYYTLQDSASKHVEIVRHHSLLFNLLSAFEPNQERQFKMLKKRANLLEVVSKELNPRYYMDICRQLWFELGEIYHDMMQIEAEKNEKAPIPQALEKVNLLINSSAKYFNLFLESVKDKKTGNLPDPLQDDLITPTLTAHFYLGRLHLKYITADKDALVENTKKACECFKYVIDYCERHDKVKDIFNEKYQISKEILTLLKLKLLKL